MKERMRVASVVVDWDGTIVVRSAGGRDIRLEVIDDLEGVTRNGGDVIRVVSDDFADPNEDWVCPFEVEEPDTSHFKEEAEERAARHKGEWWNVPAGQSHVADDLAKLRHGKRGRERRAFRTVDDTRYSKFDDLDIWENIELDSDNDYDEYDD